MHRRKRHIEHILIKRAKMFPVLGILGPRQVGKSTFLIKEWCANEKANYLTFDEKEVVTRAQRAPAQLLMDETDNLTKHLIIDEAQKVPHIFDSIKAIVDKNRRMGMFTLSGSVEFSSKSGVRESLAGRMGITKLYPMTIRELCDDDFIDPWVTLDFAQVTPPSKPRSIKTWLERGGMPIFCAISDEDERIGLVHSWLEAICYKDLMQQKDAHYNSEIAYNIMTYLATENSIFPATQLGSILGVTAAVIKKHLSALEALFLIYKIPSFENPRAHPKYTIFDAGIFNALRGAPSTFSSEHANLISLVVNEIYAQYEYAGKIRPQLYYYKTRGGAEIDLVLKTRNHLIGIECVTSVDISDYAQRGMKSFLEKHKDAVGYFIAPIQKMYSLADNMYVIPWNQIA
jgi:predicted AAA+ superfamily ATPase